MCRRLFLAVSVVVLLFSTSVSTPAQTDQPYNYAVVWQSWDDSVRDAYVRGVVDGAFNAYITAGEGWLGKNQLTRRPEPEKVGRVRQQVLLREVGAQVPPVITDLYRDPANIYVALVDMVYIARDKLEGRSVDGGLTRARARAFEVFRSAESQQNLAGSTLKP